MVDGIGAQKGLTLWLEDFRALNLPDLEYRARPFLDCNNGSRLPFSPSLSWRWFQYPHRLIRILEFVIYLDRIENVVSSSEEAAKERKEVRCPQHPH
jgi:hypothetical protein